MSDDRLDTKNEKSIYNAYPEHSSEEGQHMTADKPKRKKKEKKDSQLLIRISSRERDEFVSLCEDLDSSAAREIRRFIRSFLEKHKKSGND